MQLNRNSHWRNLRTVYLWSLGFFLLLRFIFLGWTLSEASVSAADLIVAMFFGFLIDASVLIYFLAPLAVFQIIFNFKNPKFYKFTFLTILFGICFIYALNGVGEILFWNEFSNRFNFIAVDYLVYSNEVLQNIIESYPVRWILLGMCLTAVGFVGLMTFRRVDWNISPAAPFRRFKAIGLLVALLLANYFFFPMDLPDHFKDFHAQEIAKNGPGALFHAYFGNQLDYGKFYITQDIDKVFRKLRKFLGGQSQHFNAEPYNIGRIENASAILDRKNVVLISMESMSARFLDSFGSQEHWTTNLDRLANEGMLFTNIFSTGTRTVRGLEALALSVPPTPGQSILRRPENTDLYNLGDYFLHAGYRAQFLYGGYSYFDNMKEFFEGNEMEVWDRSEMDSSMVTFANAWGVCDEDLYNLTLKKADESFAEGKPFFQLVMTTSNHRPYTYPQKIDIPSGEGRPGAIKYSDYAIGEFMKAAKLKPWFENTIFIFVADHNASVAGKTEIPIQDYRIPLIFYSPKTISPQKYTRLGSQIDVGPTILGILKAQYKSHLFGHDLRVAGSERAFLATFQKVALLKENVLTVLGPNQFVAQYAVDDQDNETLMTQANTDLIDETVSYYQAASYLFTNGKMKDSGDDQVLNWKSSSGHED